MPADEPLAFTERSGGAVRIVSLDENALRLGLVTGMSLADARARVPALVAVEHDSHADRLWLERIADACDRWTPMVELDPPDGVTLDITGCAHLHGSEAGLAADVEWRIREAGLQLRFSFARSPEAARALARFGALPILEERRAVHALPVAALRLETDAEISLRRAGLKTIGDLASRPSAPLVARFGAGMMDMLDRLLGRVDSRISPRRPPPALVFEQRFSEPVARVEDALAKLGELAGEACKTLEQQQEGGRRFIARFYRSDGVVRDVAVETGLPARDPGVVMRLFRDRTGALSDPMDAGFGFDLLRLMIPTTEALSPAQALLEGEDDAGEAVSALVDRLTARVGRERVRRFSRRDTHVPEKQAVALPAVALALPEAWPVPAVGEPPRRPLHLFDVPQRIEVMGGEIHGPPKQFRWRGGLHEVVLCEGPERIAGEWWRVPLERLPGALSPSPESGSCEAANDPRGRLSSASDRPLLTRDYFRLEDARGRRFWVFCHGLPGREVSAPAWYVHGMFP